MDFFLPTTPIEERQAQCGSHRDFEFLRAKAGLVTGAVEFALGRVPVFLIAAVRGAALLPQLVGAPGDLLRGPMRSGAAGGALALERAPGLGGPAWLRGGVLHLAPGRLRVG